MGMIIMCSFITIIAIGGTIFFHFQDKKEKKHEVNRKH